MRALATWCVRKRRLVVLFWIATLIVVGLISHAAGSAYSNSFSLPKTQSTDALNLLKAVSPKVSGDVEHIVFDTSSGAKVTDPAIRVRVVEMLTKVAKLPSVSNIISPYGAGGAGQISQDKSVAFITVTFDK